MVWLGCRLLDDNRELYVPELGEMVRPHPHFMLFATQNPAGAYGGRKVRAYSGNPTGAMPNMNVLCVLVRAHEVAHLTLLSEVTILHHGLEGAAHLKRPEGILGPSISVADIADAQHTACMRRHCQGHFAPGFWSCTLGTSPTLSWRPSCSSAARWRLRTPPSWLR